MYRRHTIRCLFVAAAVLCVAPPYGALAQQTPQPAPNATAASSEIPARLRHLEGTVTVQRAAAGETEDAVINLPLGSGDRIWSGDDGRVEIMFEDGTSIWMDAGTTLDFVSLPRPQSINGPIVRLWTGSVFVQRPEPLAGTLLVLRLDTPTGAVSFDEPGLFRVDLDDDQTVWLSAYDGSVVLDAGGLSERVFAGQRTLAETGSAPAQAVSFNTSEIDDFGNWRDERMALLASTQQYVNQREYVPPTISHYAADLEPYGSWSYHPTYAAWYWRPYAAVSWSPYRHGRWAYTYAGWSWVPSTPWGYVTTHYGRWQHGSGGWMWFPGSVWTPASVHWYVGSGHVGWVPLNYYGRPAVGFGVHVGGGIGVGISVGISWGGYYGWPYYGYGYPSWGYRPYYGCCRYGWGGGGHWGPGYPAHYPSRRGQAYPIGPIGSASGTGRVVNRRGYSSGLADAWTVVPADEFSSRDVGRVALGRSALPRDINEGSKALVSGNLRARRPSTLVPPDGRSARPTTPTAGRRAVPSGGSNAVTSAVRTTGNRSATRSTPNGAPGVGGATRRAGEASSGVRRAVPTTRQGGGAPAPGAVRTPSSRPTATGTALGRSTPAQASSSGTARRAQPRTGAVAPRSTAPSVSSAARQALNRRNGGSTAPRSPSARSAPSVRSSSSAVRTPQASRSAPAVRYPRTSRSGPAARYAQPSRSAPTVRSTPSAGRYPSVRSAPSARTYPSGRSAPSVRSSPSVRRPAQARPRGGGVRPAAAPRPGGGGFRPPAAPRPSGGGVRPAARPRPGGGGVRPAAGPRPGGAGVRPSSPSRPGGGGARSAPRAAKPRGGGTPS